VFNTSLAVIDAVVGAEIVILLIPIAEVPPIVVPIGGLISIELILAKLELPLTSTTMSVFAVLTATAWLATSPTVLFHPVTSNVLPIKLDDAWKVIVFKVKLELSADPIDPTSKLWPDKGLAIIFKSPPLTNSETVLRPSTRKMKPSSVPSKSKLAVPKFCEPGKVVVPFTGCA